MPGNKPPKTPSGQRRKCEKCKGHGEVDGKTCPACGGNGYVNIGSV